jgi:Na+-transporting methylmalonyl-CoA/oxaloacetate decarboxylase gamma subunit
MLKFPLDKYDMLEPGEAVEVAIICMLIVFAILVIIWGAVSLLKYIKIGRGENKSEPDDRQDEEPTEPVKPEIKDEKMLAAVLAATIDYTNETKKDVKLVSVKELK